MARAQCFFDRNQRSNADAGQVIDLSQIDDNVRDIGRNRLPHFIKFDCSVSIQAPLRGQHRNRVVSCVPSWHRTTALDDSCTLPGVTITGRILRTVARIPQADNF